MNAPVKLLTLSSFFKEIKHSKQEEKNPKKITLNELTDISVGAGEGLGEFKLYTITISDKNKTAILILNVGNVKTYREFIKWHDKQTTDLSWRDSLATPCPAYSLETHSLVKGSSDCKPENFRTLEQDRFAAITHPWPAGYVGIEARQNPEKGKWSGSQEIYVCAPGETVCERSTQFPTGGTVDRVSPKRGKSPRVVASISGHLIADVWPGYIARNFDGWPKWEMYPVDGNKSQQLAKFTSMYLQARPILPASGIGLAPSSLSGTGQN